MNIADSCGAEAELDIEGHKARAKSTGHIKYGPLGPLFFRPMIFEKTGDVVSGHTHNFPHVTFIWQGSVHVKYFKVNVKGERDGEIKEASYKAPGLILIEAFLSHEFTALEPNTRGHCIFPVRDFDGKPTDTWNGDMTPYV